MVHKMLDALRTNYGTLREPEKETRGSHLTASELRTLRQGLLKVTQVGLRLMGADGKEP